MLECCTPLLQYSTAHAMSRAGQVQYSPVQYCSALSCTVQNYFLCPHLSHAEAADQRHAHPTPHLWRICVPPGRVIDSCTSYEQGKPEYYTL